MTVSELRETLQDMPDEAEVFFSDETSIVVIDVVVMDEDGDVIIS